MLEWGIQNRIEVITGAARNIGLACARVLAMAGARVVLVDVDAAAGAAAAREICTGGGDAVFLSCDLSRSESVAALGEEIARCCGRPDILVNNAGLVRVMKAIDSITVEEWDLMMAVNLRNVFLCSRAVLPSMKERGGKIVNISSVTFLLGRCGSAHYVASKGGIIGFTRALAHEVGAFGVTVNAITPGAVETPEEREVTSPDEIQAIVKAQCLRRRIVPEDIAGAVLFLSSRWSNGITGQILNVDGGWAMH